MKNLTTRKITYAAFLVVISIILSRYLSITNQVFSIELGGAPIVAAGIIFGPVIGGIVGLLSDTIGHLIRPFGAWYFGFAINEALTGIIPGLIFMIFKKYKVIQKVNFFYIVLIILLILDAYGSYYLYNLTVYRGQPLTMEFRLLLIAGLNISIIACLSSIYFLKKKYKEDSGLFTIDKIVFALLMVEILVYISLTPLWLNLLFNLPLLPSRLIRVARAGFIVVFKAIMVYSIIKAARMFKKKELK